MKVILGIDPGQQTGVATFEDGKLVSLRTLEPIQIQDMLRRVMPGRVVFEDSRLQSRAWTARGKATQGAALATARSLGQVDCLCSLIAAICEDLGIPAHGISPAGKGAKLDAEQFAAITGWAGRSNQHERDSCMVAWSFRNSAVKGGAA